jgi:hypothetical protein
MALPSFGSYGNSKKASQQSEDALNKARESTEDVRDLRAQIERLQMICEGMWTILRERTGATEQQLLDLIEEIDLRDGKLDGRCVKAPAKCARCQRVVSVRTNVCLYCGSMQERTTVFG